MLIYNYHLMTLLDPYDRVRIPYMLGYLISDSNSDGNPKDVTYEGAGGVSLHKNQITIRFPLYIHDDSFTDDGELELKSERQTTQHMYPYSHYRMTIDQSQRKTPIIVKRRPVPLGKFRISDFKGMNSNPIDEEDD